MDEENKLPKDTGIGHDDDGNVDDRRIAGWIMLVASIAFAIVGILRDSSISVQVFNAGILAAVGLLGSTVAEKFAKH